ncbi:threonine-phosphate decarboxylase CobD [Propionivibrio soli]|uniref:threonine-phosphate decarboxylase CobD n=1 Tax=Propionivibrio soli TaxID=2976531 RepID=UPI0021E9319B
MLEHGGRLRAAARLYGLPLSDWLDLSTGISPHTYPVPPLDASCWNRLPEDDDELETVAAAYYGNERLLVLPGSQAAIQTLPSLFRPATVACVAPLYEEHPHAWERARHTVRRLPTLQRALGVVTPNVLLCNPNNPTGTAFSRDELLDAANKLQRRGGWLIVDEAFADAEPTRGIVDLAGGPEAPSLIVLRSLGKFFGLAGARVGFVFGAAEKLERLREMIGPWPVAHPSRMAACKALADTAWQTAMRERLAVESHRLSELLTPLGTVNRTALFCTVSLPGDPARCAALFEHFARRAILVRRFENLGLLRFGLPGDERQWLRLQAAVAEWSRTE